MSLPIPAQQETAKKIRQMNILPRSNYFDSRKSDPIYIYNIGRWAGEEQKFWVRNSGTGHTFVIPLAAQLGAKHMEDYAAKLLELDPHMTEGELEKIVSGIKSGLHSFPCLIPDPVVEFYPERLGSPTKAHPWPGPRIAQEIVNMVPGDDGVGAGKDPRSDLRYWGVFIAKGKVPTKTEMDEVRTWYFKRLEELVQTADELARDGKHKDILKVHRFAAAERQVSRIWNKPFEEMGEARKMACPSCLNPIIEGAKKCQHCFEWLDGRESAVEVKSRK